MSASTSWGRVSDDGTVYVRTAEGERVVGSWQAGDPADGLAHFERRYDDLVTEVSLLETRLASGRAGAGATLTAANRLRETIPSANVVGDLDALAARLDALITKAQGAREAEKEARAQAVAQAREAKEALAAEAEGLAQSTQWKASGDRLREIIAAWREIKGLDKKTDGELWRRVAHARNEFTRRRGAHFASLDEERKEAAARKEKLIAEAESLADSTDWVATASRLKALMSEWKAAPRASKEAEAGLWKRFRAAQDTFFTNRSKAFDERDAGLRDNAKAKEAVLAEAEALDPAADLEAAQAKLRELQHKFDDAGKAPRDAAPRLDKRMAAAASKVREVADARWRESQVENSPMVIRLRESIEKLERRIERAREAGDTAALADLGAQLETQRAWLSQAQRP